MKRIDYNKLFHDVMGILETKFTRNPNGDGERTYAFDTKDPKFRIYVQHWPECIDVTIAFEQRMGVWHAIGNFMHDPVYEEGKAFFGVEKSSCRLDRFFDGDVMAFAQQLKI